MAPAVVEMLQKCFVPLMASLSTSTSICMWADCGNNRVQLFKSGQSNATTIAGSGASGTITLSCPKGVVLDSDDHLFIVDANNNRIIGSDANGFRCIVGMFWKWFSSQSIAVFHSPVSFDSYGKHILLLSGRIVAFRSLIYHPMHVVSVMNINSSLS